MRASVNALLTCAHRNHSPSFSEIHGLLHKLATVEIRSCFFDALQDRVGVLLECIPDDHEDLVPLLEKLLIVEACSYHALRRLSRLTSLPASVPSALRALVMQKAKV